MCPEECWNCVCLILNKIHWELVISLMGFGFSLYVFWDTRNRNEWDKFFRLFSEWQREKENIELISVFSKEIIIDLDKKMKVADATLGMYCYPIRAYGILLKKHIDMLVNGKLKFSFLKDMYSGSGKIEYKHIYYNFSIVLVPTIQKMVNVYNFIRISCASDSTKKEMKVMLSLEISDQEAFLYSLFASNYVLPEDFKIELKKELKKCLDGLDKSAEKYINLDGKNFEGL